MTKPAESDTDLADLVTGLAADFRRLLGRQADLLRAELGQELRRAGHASLNVALGGGLGAASGLLSGFALAHLLHRVTRLPLWACYGGAAGACGAAAAALVKGGVDQLSNVRLVPPETTAALGENLTWLKEQVTPGKR